MFGTLGDDYLLPVAYRPLYFTRVIAWAFSPFVPLLALASYLFPGTAPGIGLYSLLPTALLEILFVYMFFGVIAYRKHPLLWLVFSILTPLAVVLHSVGALWDVVSPAETFEVTEKVTANTIKQANELDEGALAEHDGTDKLLRESDDEFEKEIFSDDD